MADALCGPSNALQNFQKHSAVDRSLQQDRFVSRHTQGQSQGFRSQAHGNAGMLDPEFEAFQAGAPMLQTSPQEFHQQHFMHQQLRQQPMPAAGGGWAADFAKLNISQPSPGPAAFHQQAAPRPAMASWHDDFGAMLNQPSTSQYQSPSFGGPMSSFNVQRPMGYMPSSQSAIEQQSSEQRWKGKGRWQSEEVHDQEAFEREFEAMATAALRAEPQSDTTELGQDTRIGGEEVKDRYLGVNELGKADQTISARDYAQNEAALEDMNLSNEPAIHEEMHVQPEPIQEQPEQRGRPDTDEDLAQTAAVLLERVSDNTSKKFQDSSFLELMRQLRDHEKRVDGDKIVDTDPGSEGIANVSRRPQSQDADIHRDGPVEPAMTGALSPDAYYDPVSNDYMGPGGHPVYDFAGGAPDDPGTPH